MPPARRIAPLEPPVSGRFCLGVVIFLLAMGLTAMVVLVHGYISL